MDQVIRAIERWPLWVRIAVTAAAVIMTYLVQIPVEREVPGEPFLLFSLVVICTTLTFGSNAGYVAVGLSTVLLTPFFEPHGSFALTRAWSLINIELYAIMAAGCVFGFARLRETLIAVSKTKECLERLDKSRALLLREIAHGVANNFATVAALLSMRSVSVNDVQAKRTLDEAVEQVKVMARVHRRLRAREQDVSLDSAAYTRELCQDLEEMVRGRPIAIECEADSHPLCMQQAVLLGLIVNELVTNAMKHAFPDGCAGRIRVRLKVFDTQLRLSVDDDGVGFRRPCSSTGMGHGQELVRGLTHELEGYLEFESTTSGSSFRLMFPLAGPGPSTASAHSAVPLLN